jgi:hypothetical protein
MGNIHFVEYFLLFLFFQIKYVENEINVPKINQENTYKSISKLLKARSFENEVHIQTKIDVIAIKNNPFFKFNCILFSDFVIRKRGMVIQIITHDISLNDNFSQKYNKLVKAINIENKVIYNG